MFIEIPASKKSLSSRKPVCGIGINDANYLTEVNKVSCPFYAKWTSMLKRCYSDSLHKRHPTYIDCTVSSEWLLFSNFKAWMIRQDWEGMHLDKDLISAGNKVYSAEFCVFVSSAMNALLTDHRSARGGFPQGVNLHKKNSKFVARCGVNGKRKYLGSFSTPEEAAFTYNRFKSNHIREIAKDYISDIRLYNGLIAHANLIDN